MPCDTRIPRGMTEAERQAQLQRALDDLEQQMLAGKARLNIGENGAVWFDGWEQNAGMNDACAFSSLQARGSFALSQAIAMAEAQSGRQINQQMVGSGVHSHDHGKHWHPGH